MAEELWSLLGCSEGLAYHAWPEFDASKLVADTVEIPVQINGKLRTRVEVAADADKDAIESAAREAAAEYLQGQVRKVVVIPGRMVNFVVTP